MSSSKESPLEIWQPTDSFLRLVEKAATDCRKQTISAKEKPITRLKSTSRSEDVQNELGRSYQEMIQSDSSTAAVFDPQKFELYWVPETFALTRGSFKIPHKTSAIAIPLVKDGNPKIEYYDTNGGTSIDWNRSGSCQPEQRDEEVDLEPAEWVWETNLTSKGLNGGKSPWFAR